MQSVTSGVWRFIFNRNKVLKGYQLEDKKLGLKRCMNTDFD